MTRVLAVMVIALTATVALGVRGHAQDEQARYREREQVAKALGRLQRGALVQITRTNGEKIDAVIQEIANGSVTLLVAENNRSTTQTISIDDIRSVKTIRAKKGMSTTHKVLLVSAIAAGIIVGACAAALANV